MNRVRATAVAGYFYPADPIQLNEYTRSMLQEAQGTELTMRPKVLIVPHAGYVYSGPIAATAYHALHPWAQTIRRVVLLGPSHRIALRGLALPDADGFATPLGDIPLDLALASQLARLPQVQIMASCHAMEHSLEVQLPFLQCVLNDFTLLPLLVGLASPHEVADVLEFAWGDESTLIVISTDLSHYLCYEDAQKRDADTLDRILTAHNHIGDQDACGSSAIRGLLLRVGELGLKGTLLDYRNSGDTAGEKDRVVGYAAVAFSEDK